MTRPNPSRSDPQVAALNAQDRAVTMREMQAARDFVDSPSGHTPTATFEGMG